MIVAAGGRREIRSRSSGWGQFLADRCRTWGISANRMSVWSLVAASAASLSLVSLRIAPRAGIALCIAAAFAICLRLLANMLDGMIADRTEATPIGILFNEVPDRVSDSIILTSAGIAVSAPTLGVIAALAALATAYVRLTATLVKVDAPFCGPMAKPRRMLVIAAALVGAAIIPSLRVQAIVAALIVISVGSLVTSVRRAQIIARGVRCQS